MGWAFCGQDDDGRDIGYGVVAECDWPGCGAEIDRGLGYICGTMHGGENGCGRYYCGAHRHDHGCDFVPDEDDPCPDDEHVWTGKQMGGSPDTAEASEWVEFCDVCGTENQGSGVLAVHAADEPVVVEKK